MYQALTLFCPFSVVTQFSLVYSEIFEGIIAIVLFRDWIPLQAPQCHELMALKAKWWWNWNTVWVV